MFSWKRFINKQRTVFVTKLYDFFFRLEYGFHRSSSFEQTSRSVIQLSDTIAPSQNWFHVSSRCIITFGIDSIVLNFYLVTLQPPWFPSDSITSCLLLWKLFQAASSPKKSLRCYSDGAKLGRLRRTYLQISISARSSHCSKHQQVRHALVIFVQINPFHYTVFETRRTSERYAVW